MSVHIPCFSWRSICDMHHDFSTEAELRPKSLIFVLLLFIYSFTLFFIFGRWLLFSVGKTVIITAANANTTTAPPAP